MVFGACSFGASAQQDSTQRQRPPMGDRMRGGGYNEEMFKDLNLSEAQKADVKKSFDEQKTKMDAAMEEHHKAGCSEASEHKYMQEAKGILNKDQYAKFKAECKKGEKEKTQT